MIYQRSPDHQQSCISINMILSWFIRTVAGSARGSLNHKTDIFKHMFGCRENPFLFALRIFPRLTILRTSLVRCGHDIWPFVVVRRDIVVGIFFCTDCHDAGYTPYIKLCHIQCKCYAETEINIYIDTLIVYMNIFCMCYLHMYFEFKPFANIC